MLAPFIGQQLIVDQSLSQSTNIPNEKSETAPFLTLLENLVGTKQKMEEKDQFIPELMGELKKKDKTDTLHENISNVMENAELVDDLPSLLGNFERLLLTLGIKITSITSQEEIPEKKMMQDQEQISQQPKATQRLIESTENGQLVKQLAMDDVVQQTKDEPGNDFIGKLQQAVRNQEIVPVSESSINRGVQDRPMTPIEQHTFHVGRTHQVGEQLIERFYSVLREINFQQNEFKLDGLNMMLKPKQVGPVAVRFTQVDGEVLVKMVVSTHMAKELFEANLHQLRHVFSPHQVVIELDGDHVDEEFLDGNDQRQQEKDPEYEKEHGERQMGQAEIGSQQSIDFHQIFMEQKEEMN